MGWSQCKGSVDIGTSLVWRLQPTMCCRRRLNCVQLFSYHDVLSRVSNFPMMMFSKFRTRIALSTSLQEV